jgi:hypothetical protein
LAPPQLRKWRLLVLTGAFDVHDCVARDPTLTLQFGTELARSAKFDVVGEELIIDRIGAALDDDAVRFQHEPRHHAIFAAPAQ